MAYYAVHDPFHKLGKRTLRLFRLEAGKYIGCASANWMPEIGLGLTLWQGVFQDVEAEWLRFVDEEGRVIPTGGARGPSKNAAEPNDWPLGCASLVKRWNSRANTLAVPGSRLKRASASVTKFL